MSSSSNTPQALLPNIVDSAFILALGYTGSNKTKFIHEICGISSSSSKDSESCGIFHVPANKFNFPIALVDTPSFVDLTPPGINTTLERIRRFVDRQELKIKAILYFHHMDDRDSANNSDSNIFTPATGLFNVYNNHVAIVTMGWGSSSDSGCYREQEGLLQTKHHQFHPVLQRGAKLLRYDGTSNSAQDTIGKLLAACIAGRKERSSHLNFAGTHSTNNTPTLVIANGQQSLDEMADSLDRLQIQYHLSSPGGYCIICGVQHDSSSGPWCSDRCKGIDIITRTLYSTFVHSSTEDKPRWKPVTQVLADSDQRRKKKAMAMLCESGNAKVAINVVQAISDHLKIWQSAVVDREMVKHIHNLIRRLLMKMSLKTMMFPDSLFLNTGVTKIMDQELISGGVADIHHGMLGQVKVALKRMREFDNMTSSVKDMALKEVYHEVLTWKNMDHTNIVPFLGVNDRLFRVPCIIVPWMTSGHIIKHIDTLRSVRGSDPGGYLMKKIHEWLRQVLLALEYLHDEKIVHGDLRGHNILIDDRDCARLTDFGMAVYSQATSQHYGSVRGGNQAWMAPEQLDPKSFGLTSLRPTVRSDIYSFGGVCIELYTGEPPRKIVSDKHHLDQNEKQKIINGHLPDRPHFFNTKIMDKKIWEVVEHCMAREPQKRPSAKELIVKLPDAIEGKNLVLYGMLTPLCTSHDYAVG
ncbi:EKC/KEOPS complex subunit BUD32 [Abortiporus biennis]